MRKRTEDNGKRESPSPDVSGTATPFQEHDTEERRAGTVRPAFPEKGITGSAKPPGEPREWRSVDVSSEQGRHLVLGAASAQVNAYAPYSRFRVGAALLGCDGRIFYGCNVENASYGLTICAERVAVCAAVTGGCRRFAAIAVVGERMPRPCGACLQTLAEFCDDDFQILLALESKLDAIAVRSLKQLLPERFSLLQPL